MRYAWLKSAPPGELPCWKRIVCSASGRLCFQCSPCSSVDLMDPHGASVGHFWDVCAFRFFKVLLLMLSVETSWEALYLVSLSFDSLWGVWRLVHSLQNWCVHYAQTRLFWDACASSTFIAAMVFCVGPAVLCVWDACASGMTTLLVAPALGVALGSLLPVHSPLAMVHLRCSA